MSALFGILAVLHLALLALLLRRGGRVLAAATLAVPAVLLALAYDNAIMGLGNALGDGPVLETVSRARFTLHVLLTPTLVLVAARLASLGGLDPDRRLSRLAVPATVALVVLGITLDGLVPSLALDQTAGVLRYTHADPTIPIAAVLTDVALIAVGVGLWRRGVTRWLAVGAIVMFVASAASPGSLPLLGNLGEAVLLAGIVAACLEVGGAAMRSDGDVADALPDDLSLGAR